MLIPLNVVSKQALWKDAYSTVFIVAWIDNDVYNGWAFQASEEMVPFLILLYSICYNL